MKYPDGGSAKIKPNINLMEGGSWSIFIALKLKSGV